jgi:hypothetical protein
MRNSAWNEMGRIYTKKSSQKHSHTKIADRNYKLRTVNALWFILEKMTKIADRNYGNCGPQKLGWKREFWALKWFSQERYIFLTSSRPEHLSTVWRGDQKEERRGITPLERDRKENSRTGWEIVDLLGVVFSLLFSHVVLLFKHESWYNLWHDLWLDTLLGV